MLKVILFLKLLKLAMWKIAAYQASRGAAKENTRVPDIIKPVQSQAPFESALPA